MSGKEKGRAASTAIMMRQATQASVIPCPGKTAGSRCPPGKPDSNNHAGKHRQ